MTLGFYCRRCGQPVIQAGGEYICVNDPGCLQEMQEEEGNPDCAPEGHTYAVYGSDQ
jgi:hypothetical protein